MATAARHADGHLPARALRREPRRNARAGATATSAPRTASADPTAGVLDAGRRLFWRPGFDVAFCLINLVLQGAVRPERAGSLHQSSWVSPSVPRGGEVRAAPGARARARRCSPALMLAAWTASLGRDLAVEGRPRSRCATSLEPGSCAPWPGWPRLRRSGSRLPSELQACRRGMSRWVQGFASWASIPLARFLIQPL